MKSVINLIRTPLGFSLIEGDVEINKSSNKIVKEKAYSLPKSTLPPTQNTRSKILRSTHTFLTRMSTTINTS